MQESDKGSPRDLFDKACCIVILTLRSRLCILPPRRHRAVRNSGGHSYRRWKLCLQIGGSATDVFILIMNEGGIKSCYPISSRSAARRKPLQVQSVAMPAPILTSCYIPKSCLGLAHVACSRASLEGSTLRPDNKENEKLYGAKLSNRQILSSEAKTPTAARPLIADRPFSVARISRVQADAGRSKVLRTSTRFILVVGGGTLVRRMSPTPTREQP
jgi:hypothetical protein